MSKQFDDARKLLNQAERLLLLHYFRVILKVISIILFIIGFVFLFKSDIKSAITIFITIIGINIIRIGLGKYIDKYIAYIDDEVKRQRKEQNNHE